MTCFDRRQFVLECGAGMLAALGQPWNVVRAADSARSAPSDSAGPTRKGARVWHTEAVPADWHERFIRRFMVGQHLPDRDQADLEGILRDYDLVVFDVES